MGRGTCQATVHGVTKSQTQLKWFSMHACALSNSFHDFILKKVASTFYKFLAMVIKEMHTHTHKALPIKI